MGLGRLRLLFALVGVAEAALIPFLPIVLHDRGLSAAEIGAALAAAALAGFVALPVWGYVADRHLGARRALALGSIAAALATVPLPFVHGFAALTGVVVLVTAARSSIMSLADVVALEQLSGPARSDYGRVRLWLSIGWAIAACVWGLVLQTGSLSLLPALYAGGLVGVAIAAHAVGGGGRVLHERAPRGARRAMLRGLVAFLASLLLVYAAFSATMSFVAVRIAELRGGLFVIGLAAALQAVAEVPVMRATPRLSRAVGHRAVYVAGTVFVGLACVGWALVDDAVVIALVKLVAGVGFALVYIGSVLVVDDLAPPGLRGTGQGVAKAVSFGLAPIVGTLAGGVVYDYAGSRALFALAAAAALCAGGVVWAVGARRELVPVAAPGEAPP